MSGVESEVLETFLAQISETEGLSPSLTSALGQLLAADRLPKADAVAALYSDTSGESVL